MVSRPSQPGGMRISINAIAYGRSSCSACCTRATPSSPCKAVSIWKAGREVLATAPPNSRRSAASSSGLPPALPPRIFRKSSWIARLSSTTSTRRLPDGRLLAMWILGRFPGQFEKESCAAARTGTLGAQNAADLLGRERSAVQPEAMTGLLGGKPVCEDATHVRGCDPAAVVRDRDLHARPAPVDAYRDAPLLLGHALAGVLGVA